jgi:PAS domain-containing protein
LSPLSPPQATAASVVLYRRGQSQEETIRRQLAAKFALKARFDDLFDRSSEIMIVHDRRGRVSTINRSGEQVTGYLATSCGCSIRAGSSAPAMSMRSCK